MPSVKFIAADGGVQDVAGDDGETVMRTAVDAGVPGIDGECGGALSCATCHVIVDPAWWDRVGPPSEYEAGMLEEAPGAGEASRLSCQIRLSDALDGLIVRIPAHQ